METVLANLGLLTYSGCFGLRQSGLCLRKFLMFSPRLFYIAGSHSFQKVSFEFSHFKKFVIIE